ncbi:MAG: HD domain-containing phosphohydrolase, partial [Bacillota bacterium]
MGLFLHKQKKAFREYCDLFREWFHNSNEGVFLLSPANGNFGCFLEINNTTLNWLGYTREELLKMSIGDLLIKKDRLEALDKLKSLVKTGHTAFEACLVAKKGLRVPAEIGAHIFYHNGADLIFTTARDISARKSVEEELTNTNQKLMGIIDFLPDPTFVIDREQRVIAWNHAIAEMTGIKKEEIMGKGDFEYAEFFYGQRKPMLINMVGTILENPGDTVGYKYIKRKGETLYGEVFVPRLNGGQGATIWAKAAPLYDKNQNWVGAIETIRDLTDRKQIEEQVKYLGTHDQLTGLYDRAFFQTEVDRLIKNEDNLPIGMIFCNIDGFKEFNETYGHKAGDDFLVKTAGLIKSAVDEGATVARIGGDEFAVLLLKSNRLSVESVIKRIRGAVAAYNGGHPESPLSLSIGYVISKGSQLNVDTLLSEADDNMKREKLFRRQSPRSNIIQTLVTALRERDFDTEGHTDRLQELVIALGSAINLPEHTLTNLRLLAQFHDIGKVGIPDRLLLKPGALTSEEIVEMRKHCEIGYRIAQASSELRPVADWIYKHHEWWNGSGYPLGLKGEKIPLECRILAIADAYDAMTNDRPYRKALTKEEALSELRKWAGIQFDPEL